MSFVIKDKDVDCVLEFLKHSSIDKSLNLTSIVVPNVC